MEKKTENAEQFFAAKDEKYQVYNNLRKLQLEVKNKTYNPSDKNLKSYCPKNISRFEEDGFVSNALPRDLSAQKYELSLLCRGLLKPPVDKEVKNVKLKKDKCACFTGSAFEDYNPVQFKKDEIFYTEVKDEKKFTCRLREHHVVCYFPNPCDTEGCGFWPIQKICPKECMQWDLVKE